MFPNETFIGEKDTEQTIPAPAVPGAIKSSEVLVIEIAEGKIVLMVTLQLPDRTLAVMTESPGTSGAVQTKLTDAVAEVGVPLLAVQSAASTAVNVTTSNNPTVVLASVVPSGARRAVALVMEQGGGAGAGVDAAGSADALSPSSMAR